MSEQTPVKHDDPMMVAWNKYKETDEFKNTNHWTIEARNEEQSDGVLWGAFIAGYAAALNAGLASEWVAVSERLPTGGKEYLVTVDDDSVDGPTTMLAHWLGDVGPRGSFLTPDHYHADIGTVTAWCELPSPYEPAGGE